jgi:aryl-phospho-beta-D-glucosidase BglC (GH1 family)
MSKFYLSVFILLLFSVPALAQTSTSATGYHAWWNDQYPQKPWNSPNARKLPLISVKGNKLVDPQGNAILFRGLAIADPDKIEHEGHFNLDFFQHVQQMGARVVRIPVHPIAWRERGSRAYLGLLDQAVEWCTSLGMYVDIDWHSIGNLETEVFQDPMYQTSRAETFNFWRAIANHFAGNNTIAFYEFFNEPSASSDKWGPASWEEWKKINEDLVVLIRAYDRTKIPLIAGFDWAYDLTPLHNSPIDAEGIAYSVHPYPFKRPKPWEPRWDSDFGFAASRFPVVATEFGFWGGPQANPAFADYGPTIIKYLESRGISWFCWVYDPEWEPQLIKSWDFSLTDSGRFFSDAMQGKVP